MKRSEVDRSKLSPMMNHYVELKENYSEGGKKSSYYSITNKGLQYFKDCFFLFEFWQMVFKRFGLYYIELFIIFLHYPFNFYGICSDVPF